MFRIAFITTVFLLTSAALLHAEERTWTSIDGAFRLQAELVGAEGSQVRLKRSDNGQEITVKLELLSQPDREYVRSLADKATSDAPTAGDAAPAPAGAPKSEVPAADDAKGEVTLENAPPPDYRSLLMLYYAAQSDLLKVSESFLGEVYAVYMIPPKASGPITDEYRRLQDEMKASEFARKRIVEQIRTFAAAKLAGVEKGPTVQRFRVQWKMQLDRYDEAIGGFPFDRSYYDLTFHNNTDTYSWQLPEGPHLIVPRMVTPRARPADPFVQFSWNPLVSQLEQPLFPKGLFQRKIPGSFPIVVEGIGRMPALSMKPAQAEAFLLGLPQQKGQPDRWIPLDVLLEVGPMQIAEGQLQPVPARVVLARALHPGTGQVLQTFAAEQFLPGESAPPAAGGKRHFTIDEAPALNRRRMALLQIQKDFQLVLPERLEELTLDQIRREVFFWKHFQQDRGTPEQLMRYATSIGLNPRHPLMYYQWQKLDAAGSPLASGALPQLLTGDDRAWEFLKSEKGYDPRYKIEAGVFMFDREKIIGRDPEITAPELRPVVKKLVQTTAAKAPRQAAIRIPLGEVEYDPETLALLPQRRGSSDEEPAFDPLNEITTADFGRPRKLPAITFPESLRDKTLYEVKFFGEASDPVGETAVRMFDRAPRFSQETVNTLRDRIGVITNYPVAVALDRQIHFDRVPLTRKTVDKLAGIRDWHARMQMRIVVSELDVALTEQHGIENPLRPGAIIVGKVQGVEIETSKGEPVAFIPATDLPASIPHVDDDPFARAASSGSTDGKPGDSPGAPADGAARPLTPAAIPLLVARLTPESFEQYLDQFLVARIQHEFWFRENPEKNNYGVDPQLGQALPPFEQLPPQNERQELAAPFREWAKQNSPRLENHFTLRFGKFDFRDRRGEEAPAPAVLEEAVYGSPHSDDLGTATSSYRLFPSRLHPNQRFKPITPEESQKDSNWSQLLSRAPAEIYFGSRQYAFVTPNADGERANPQSRQGSFAGGQSTIAGVPVARPTTEPIFPVLRVDKELWLPPDAALAPNQPYALEIEFEAADIEIVDLPPPHPWIEAYLQYQNSVPPQMHEYRQANDAGNYLVIQAAVKAARLVNTATEETAVQLVVKDYRPIKLAPVAPANPPATATPSSSAQPARPAPTGTPRYGASTPDASTSNASTPSVPVPGVPVPGVSKPIIPPPVAIAAVPGDAPPARQTGSWAGTLAALACVLALAIGGVAWWRKQLAA
ncbi:SHD1 domain-containing protein [Lignipirellula cremea]|uniref:SLA1 homology domain-containing protein n=1 Tax=Lignipirellula cremea TaxID=2528010 RepID=A0A518DL57_9BACT|nr:SHD1 domain-containing protein [Lignipirellula cremea]QDU92567.1 hypothetical protein Pla8534_03150 [Lignipirellula cremea]